MRKLIVPGLLSALALSACGGSSNSSSSPATPPPPVDRTASYTIAVTNLTNAQPLSPIAVVGHDGSFQVFAIGAPATPGLEDLAESGSNAAFIAEAEAAGALQALSGAGVIMPGANDSVSMVINDEDIADLNLSVATMLVNTNDAFTGVNRLDISVMAVGETRQMNLIAYDAGTEADTEEAATIPGPAAGGEGFNAARDDDADRVSMHAGVVTSSDGLATSGLTEQHRFDNPVARLSITRTD